MAEDVMDPEDEHEKPEHPHGGPPGQAEEGPPGHSGEHPSDPEHPHGGPPGQEPHPEHPIVEPDDKEKP